MAQKVVVKKKTQAESTPNKPTNVKLGHISSQQRTIFGVDLNLFTLLAIIAVVAVLVVCINMKSQISGLESKIQVMLATM